MAGSSSISVAQGAVAPAGGSAPRSTVERGKRSYQAENSARSGSTDAR